MMVGEILREQRGRPDGRAVIEVTRVSVDDRINERINDARQSPGAACARCQEPVARRVLSRCIR